MSKVPFKPGTMVYPVPAVMVSCGDSPEKYNIITVAWTGTINSTPPMTYVSVRKERHSHNLIKESGSFVINLSSEDLVQKTDYCGVKSGREVNKFVHLGLTAIPAEKVAAPMIEESPVSIECKVTQVLELGSHDMFMAEVVAIHVNEELIDKNGKLHLEWSKPIVYSHGEYYGVGEALGQFGFSVMKKKTAEKVAKLKAEEQRILEKRQLKEEKKAKKEAAREAWEQNQKEWYAAKTNQIKEKEDKKRKYNKEYDRPYIKPEEWEVSPLNPKNQTRTSDKPYGDRQRTGRSFGSKPSGDRPYGNKPSGDKPHGSKPSSDKPNSGKTFNGKAYSGKPHGTRPNNLKNKSGKREK